MPRQPRFKHPVRLLREALGYSQKDFAKQCGISESMLQKVELGKREISPELGDCLMITWGVTVASLKNQRGLPVTLIKGQNLNEAIEKWKGMRNIIRTAAFSYSENLVDRLEAIVDAARRNDNASGGQKTIVLVLALERWIEDQVRQLGLRALLRTIRIEREVAGQPLYWEKFVGENFGRSSKYRFEFNTHGQRRVDSASPREESVAAPSRARSRGRDRKP